MHKNEGGNVVPENESESQITGELYTSPLRSLALETHEIYLELLAAGFPERVVSMIMAQIISDAVLYRTEFDGDEEDEDEEDHDHEGDDPFPE